ncbi:hypothetical protein TRIUR3_21701 [Triticum urartu]|uniref:Amino acid transporter transmembrane domain-containing protein n=1 Tax=Triticum urartu TaxID=4572 RepID=M8AKQ6_TRIUA|nr:hypothetical protein TRIUR3_21701 [Triticum urartu]
MGDAFGALGRGLLQLCVVVNNIGVMVVYMIIIGTYSTTMSLHCSRERNALTNLWVLWSTDKGDVLSGTTSSGKHHHGVFEGWFGPNRWNGRFAILLFTTLAVFTPLTCFKRVDKREVPDFINKAAHTAEHSSLQQTGQNPETSKHRKPKS